MKLIELLFSRSSVICLIWFLVFLFGGLRAQSAIGSAEKREQTKKPNETNEAEDKEVEWTTQLTWAALSLSFLCWRKERRESESIEFVNGAQPKRPKARGKPSQLNNKLTFHGWGWRSQWKVRVCELGRSFYWLDWACFSLWVNENWWNQFKCSAKKDASQAKQSNQSF